MPLIQYKKMNLRKPTLAMIARARKILNDYAAKGYTLTVRQLHYAFVSKDIYANTMENYDRLGDIVAKGRLCGFIDWDHIEDRTRNLSIRSHFESPNDVIQAAFRSYRKDRWRTQEYRPEVWIEKDALSGVFERVCNKWDVPLFACRGYTSLSEAWAASQRLLAYEDEGYIPVILHFGDHDPSGIDMTRDIRDRLSTFGLDLDVNRLALNMDQVDQYQPPPNPAKPKDSRFRSYRLQFGTRSWELDALEPDVLIALVEKAILEFRDPDKWLDTTEEEIGDRALLKTTSNHWGDVAGFLKKKMPKRTEAYERALRDDKVYEHELTGE